MNPVEASSVSVPFASGYESVETPSGAAPISLLPAPSALPGVISGDVGAELAALAVASGEVERTAATDARNADEARAVSEAEQELQAIRSQAQSLRQEAWFDGATTVATLTAGGSSQALGSVIGGAKALGDGLYGADQKDDEASARGYEAGVTAARFAGDGAHDALSAASDFIRSALDFYKEYVTTRAQTSSAALRGS